ncbi:MAG: hypothetical protein DKT66_27935 [Candidatus Melainabacteria bacterium]|nr:MAG: hypothetical protein DKT66_27935 [Candidatus Melainabacteria bacterium]
MNNISSENAALSNAAVSAKSPARDNQKKPEVSVSLSQPLKRPVTEEHDVAVLTAQASAAPVVIVVGNRTPDRAELAKEEMTRALQAAELSVKPFLLHRELKAARAELAKAPGSEEAQQKVSKLAGELQKMGQGKYAQTTKAIHTFATAVVNYLDCETDESVKTSCLADSVKKIENLMCGPDNLYKGIPNKTPDIPRFADSSMTSLARLEQLELHMREKISKMDGDQAQRIKKVEGIPVLVNLLNRTSVPATRFSEDAVFFFNQEGILVDGIAIRQDADFDQSNLDKVMEKAITICGACVVRPERTEAGEMIALPDRANFKMSRPVIARRIDKVFGKVPDDLTVGTMFDLANDAFAVFFREDGTLIMDHGTELPKPVDIVRLRKAGVGPEGGGFHRFIDENIAGMAVIMKKYTPDGKPLQIRGTNGLIAKEVVEVVGKVPSRMVLSPTGQSQEIPLVKPGTSYGNLLKTFRERNRLVHQQKKHNT